MVSVARWLLTQPPGASIHACVGEDVAASRARTVFVALPSILIP